MECLGDSALLAVCLPQPAEIGDSTRFVGDLPSRDTDELPQSLLSPLFTKVVFMTDKFASPLNDNPGIDMLRPPLLRP